MFCHAGLSRRMLKFSRIVFYRSKVRGMNYSFSEATTKNFTVDSLSSDKLQFVSVDHILTNVSSSLRTGARAMLCNFSSDVMRLLRIIF